MRKDAVLLATRNKGKIKEFAALLAPFGLNVLMLDDFPALQEVEETGTTFEDNALLKASYAATHSGLIAIADDSGIMVDALNGAPGVHSARFSVGDKIFEAMANLSIDQRNNLKLLLSLNGVPEEQRTARFCSVIAAVAPSGESICAKGVWEGKVSDKPYGENGFGYDPIFIDPASSLTAAQLEQGEKNKISHRAKAMQQLAQLWPDYFSSILR